MRVVVVALVVIVPIVLYLAMTVRSRQRIDGMHEGPRDLRRAGDDRRPPYDGRGEGI